MCVRAFLLINEENAEDETVLRVAPMVERAIGPRDRTVPSNPPMGRTKEFITRAIST